MEGGVLRFKHTLIVGGSGALRESALALAHRSECVSVLARRPERLNALLREARPARVNPLAVDYTDADACAAALDAARRRHGLFTLAVLWLRPPDAAVRERFARDLDAQGNPLRLFELVADAHRDPSLMAAKARRRELFDKLPNVRHREVLLGWVRGSDGPRWVDPPEINRALLAAIEGDRAASSCGRFQPWTARP